MSMRKNHDNENKRTERISIGIAIGAGGGVGPGVALMNITGLPWTMAVTIGAGILIGMSIAWILNRLDNGTG